MNEEFEFADRVVTWFQQHGRQHLPWQQDPTPYRVWVSEIMLQQTQVATVIPFYTRFIKQFPTIDTLAQATQDEVLHQWTGLGYYARARNLHKASRIIHTEYNNQFPEDIETLLTLPGIGRSTAGAILTLACKQRHPILDGNVKRVLTRYHAISGWPGQSNIEKILWQLAEQHTPHQHVAEYTQAMMDLGASVCVRGKPRCDVCPLTKACLARQQNNQMKFPTAKTKKHLPVRDTVFIIMQNDKGEYLLQKRPPTGIWGGLWSFPECKKNADINYWVKENFSYEVKTINIEPTIQHTFSHFQLDITPAVVTVQPTKENIRENGRYRWSGMNNGEQIGLPAPVKKIVEELNATHGTLCKAG